MSKYCAECGKELELGDLFCLECGAKVFDEDSKDNTSQKSSAINKEKKIIPPPVIKGKNDDQKVKQGYETKKVVRDTTPSLEKHSKYYEKKIFSSKNLLYVFVTLILIVFVFFMVFKDSNEQNETIKKLDQIEAKIQGAIKDKNYDYASIMVDQITYSVNLNDEENQKIAQQYDNKKKSLRATITKLKEELNSTTSNLEKIPPSTDFGSVEKLTPISNNEVENFILKYIYSLKMKEIGALLSLYSDEVDYFGAGWVGKDFIEKDKNNYYKSWDRVNYWLVENSVSIGDLQNNSKSVLFRMGYSVYSTKRGKSTDGIAENTLKIRYGKNGLEIYDEKQNIISSNSSENSSTPPAQTELVDYNEELKKSTNNKSGTILQKSDEQSIYFTTAEEMPEPVGGISEIQKNLIYPEIAKRAGVEGKVYVLAFVNEQGEVTKAQIIKGIGAGCDEAALNAVLKTRFTPGKQRGKPVKVQVSIPIIFKLQ